jgi:hypothetical protein
MEKDPDDAPDQIEPPDPPPFDPDPDLITHLERGDKPTREEVREVTQRQ